LYDSAGRKPFAAVLALDGGVLDLLGAERAPLHPQGLRKYLPPRMLRVISPPVGGGERRAGERSWIHLLANQLSTGRTLRSRIFAIFTHKEVTKQTDSALMDMKGTCMGLQDNRIPFDAQERPEEPAFAPHEAIQFLMNQF
jgi:hypothetical protein